MIAHRRQIMPGVWIATIEPSRPHPADEAPYRFGAQVNPRSFARRLARARQSHLAMEDYYQRYPTARPYRPGIDSPWDRR